MNPISILEATSRLEALFRPRAIAVIGASENPDSVGAELMRNLLDGNYQGVLYPVNPKYHEQATRHRHEAKDTRIMPYLASAEDLPDRNVELAIIMTPAVTVPGILAQLGEKHVPAVVVISAGFREIGPEGQKRAEQLTQILNQYNMTLVGPNCLGIANMAKNIRMNATFAKTRLRLGYGAIFSQSGAVGIDLILRGSQANHGFSQFVSLGNSLDLQPDTLLSAWKDDPAIRYVLGYLESGALLAGLRGIAREFTITKPILMLKAGRSSVGAQAARSHTGAMAGSEDAVNAMLQQCGIQRFNTIEALLAAATAFEYCPNLRGNRVAVLSNAGGYAVMTSDLLLSGIGKPYGLTLAEFSESTRQRLNRLLPETASPQNPIDTTATFPADQPVEFRKVLEAIVQDPAVDACIVEIIEIMDLNAMDIAELVAEVQPINDKPILCVFSRTSQAENAQPPIALYASLSEAIIGLGALNHHRLRQERPDKEEMPLLTGIDSAQAKAILKGVTAEERTLLTTSESLSLLQAYGIQTPGFQIVQTCDDALVQARALGYPLAIKLNSKTVSHKTDVGGVQVDIRTETELQEAYNRMIQKLDQAGITRFDAGEGIMLQPYLPTGRELILGFKTDPDFGKLILIGRGGIYTQLDQDFQIRLNPISPFDVRDMIQHLKAYPILKGYRGKPGIDFENLEEMLLRLSILARDFPEIDELDINPYLALPENSGSGAAIDARIILKAR